MSCVEGWAEICAKREPLVEQAIPAAAACFRNWRRLSENIVQSPRGDCSLVFYWVLDHASISLMVLPGDRDDR